jgi:hypothetical protein
MRTSNLSEEEGWEDLMCVCGTCVHTHTYVWRFKVCDMWHQIRYNTVKTFLHSCYSFLAFISKGHQGLTFQTLVNGTFHKASDLNSI